MKLKKLHFGKIIANYIEKNNYVKADIAKKMGKRADVLGFLLKQESLKSNDIYNFSIVLQHNFFKEMAELIPNHFPPFTKQEDEYLNIIEALKKENEDLKKENQLLEKTLTIITKR